MRFELLLEFYRRQAGLSRRELAESSGVSEKIIEGLEYGAHRKLFENLILLAIALELHPEQILVFVNDDEF